MLRTIKAKPDSFEVKVAKRAYMKSQRKLEAPNTNAKVVAADTTQAPTTDDDALEDHELKESDSESEKGDPAVIEKDESDPVVVSNDADEDEETSTETPVRMHDGDRNLVDSDMQEPVVSPKGTEPTNDSEHGIYREDRVAPSTVASATTVEAPQSTVTDDIATGDIAIDASTQTEKVAGDEDEPPLTATKQEPAVVVTDTATGGTTRDASSETEENAAVTEDREMVKEAEKSMVSSEEKASPAVMEKHVEGREVKKLPQEQVGAATVPKADALAREEHKASLSAAAVHNPAPRTAHKPTTEILQKTQAEPPQNMEHAPHTAIAEPSKRESLDGELVQKLKDEHKVEVSTLKAAAAEEKKDEAVIDEQPKKAPSSSPTISKPEVARSADEPLGKAVKKAALEVRAAMKAEDAEHKVMKVENEHEKEEKVKEEKVGSLQTVGDKHGDDEEKHEGHFKGIYLLAVLGAFIVALIGVAVAKRRAGSVRRHQLEAAYSHALQPPLGDTVGPLVGEHAL